MYIPKTFKRAIEKTFYDKSIFILDKTATRDVEGDYIEESTNKVDEFIGNVSFSNFKEIKEEYGLEYDIGVVISTLLKNKDKINLSTLISYNDIIYEITDKFERDSHLLLIGSVWE